MFWVAMETHPELNEKIELMVLYNKRLPSGHLFVTLLWPFLLFRVDDSIFLFF